MSQEKYIGMDVHQATISAAVMDAHGKLLMECLLETKASTIVDFIQGLHGTLSLTFEEGTSAACGRDSGEESCKHGRIITETRCAVSETNPRRGPRNELTEKKLSVMS